MHGRNFYSWSSHTNTHFPQLIRRVGHQRAQVVGQHCVLVAQHQLGLLLVKALQGGRGGWDFGREREEGADWK